LAVNATTLALYIPALHGDLAVVGGDRGQGGGVPHAVPHHRARGPDPVLLVTVLGVRATPALTRLRDGLERHGRQLTVGLCLGFGALLLAAAARVAIQVA
jgi:hypothetical protein